MGLMMTGIGILEARYWKEIIRAGNASGDHGFLGVMSPLEAMALMRCVARGHMRVVKRAVALGASDSLYAHMAYSWKKNLFFWNFEVQEYQMKTCIDRNVKLRGGDWKLWNAKVGE